MTMKQSINILHSLLLSLSFLTSCAPSIIPDLPSHVIEEPHEPSDDDVAAPDHAYLRLSVEYRETQSSGTDHAEFMVTSNVGFDPIVDEDFRDWISIVSINEGAWVVVSIAENTATEAREGTIKVWDAGHNFYKVYTVHQKGKTQAGGDDWSIDIADEIDGGDYHIE